MSRPAPIRIRHTRKGRVERVFREPPDVVEALRSIGAVAPAENAAHSFGFTLLGVLRGGRRTWEAAARHAVISAVVSAKRLSIRGAADVFGLDRTTVRYALRQVLKRDPSFAFEIEA